MGCCQSPLLQVTFFSTIFLITLQSGVWVSTTWFRVRKCFHSKHPPTTVPGGLEGSSGVTLNHGNPHQLCVFHPRLFFPTAVTPKVAPVEDTVSAEAAPLNAVANRAAGPRQGLNLLEQLKTSPDQHGQPLTLSFCLQLVSASA